MFYWGYLMMTYSPHECAWATNRLDFVILLCICEAWGLPQIKCCSPRWYYIQLAERLKFSPVLWQHYAAREETRWEQLPNSIAIYNASLRKKCALVIYILMSSEPTRAYSLLKFYWGDIIFKPITLIEKINYKFQSNITIW